MKENIYKKTEYYLYNYKNIDKLIEDIKQDIIDTSDGSVNAWLKGLKHNSNSVENQAIKIADSKKIQYLKKAKIIIDYYMNIFKKRNLKRYEFIKLKYLDKANSTEIEKSLRYNKKQQIDITNMVVSFFYRQFKKAGIGGM